jgi:dihydrofolate synthase/folylpolyglutamate synthase
MRVNGKPASEAELQALHNELKPHIGAVQPSFFEYVTAMAFLHFARKGCSYVVLETGLGGRLDATNVTNPELAIVTTIALDHMEQLGPTRARIAREKAGIFKPGKPALVGERDPETESVFTAVATEKQAILQFAEDRIQVECTAAAPGGWIVTANGQTLGELHDVQTDIRATWQLHNLQTTLAAVDLLAHREGVPEPWRTAIHAALPHAQQQTGLRGRLEWVATNMLLDVAHNPAGMQALQSFVEQLPPQPTVLVLGLSGDKDIEGVLDHLPPAERILAVQASNPRAYPAPELTQKLQARGLPAHEVGTVTGGLAQAQLWAEANGGRIIVTGSLFVVGEALSSIQEAGR